jgi:SAM-dependent methyltransferase
MLIDPEDLELKTLRSLASFARQRVVEIGAGDGRLAWPLAPEAAVWVALDPDPEEVQTGVADLAAAPQALPVCLLIADGRALALPADHFDLALFSWSLC